MKLNGFLTDSDVNTINLIKDSVKLQYESKEVGVQKVVIKPDYEHSQLDGSIKRDAFFGLEGDNSSNYRIDEQSLFTAGGIRSEILARPVNIKFYSVAKEYDGTDSLDPQTLRYKICDCGDKDSGLVLGTDYRDPRLQSTVKIVRPPEQDHASYELSGYEPESFTAVKTVHPTLLINDGKLTASLEGTCNRLSFPLCVDKKGKFTLFVEEPSLRNYDEAGRVSTYDSSDAKPIRLPFNLYRVPTNTEGIPQGDGLKIKITQTLVESADSSEKPEGLTYTESDVGKVLLSIDEARFRSKNASSKVSPLSITNPKLIGGPRGDASHNYALNHIEGYGQIYQRRTGIKLSVEPKVYDGTNSASYKITEITRKVEGDDLSLNTGIDLIVWDSKDVGAKPVITSSGSQVQWLQGADRDNYSVCDTEIVNSPEITPKHITCSIHTLRVFPDQDRYEVSYELEGTISGDDVWLDLSESKVSLGPLVTMNNMFKDNSTVTSDPLHADNGSPLVAMKDLSTSAVYNFQEQSIVDITNFKLVGKDSKNYILDTESVAISLYIMNMEHSHYTPKEEPDDGIFY